jgi:uncharacterized protein with NAD-binding domain and iron-sulfur cluster
VLDNLVTVNRLELARFDRPAIVADARFPRSLADLEVALGDVFDADLGLAPSEIAFFAARLWQIMTSCDARRLAEYEKVTWADFLEARRHSNAYRHLLVNGLSRSLLANDPLRASARTVGDTNVQLLFGMLEPGKTADRVLNGPTTDVWLAPWQRFLERQPGFHCHQGAEARRILTRNGRIAGVEVRTGDGDAVVTADYFVFAVPVERMAALLAASRTSNGSDPLRLDPALAGIRELAENVAWMNGVQFFLKRDVSVVHGHTLHVDSPWALTSISEAQFWSELDVEKTGDGRVHGVLSVCISDWAKPGIVYGRPAARCTRDEIAREVWAQVKRGLNVGGRVVLDDDDLHSWFVDPDIEGDPHTGYQDAEPLLINVANTWSKRPGTRTEIPNMFLAADYVRTNTDVACMEAANEAARRAVNGILDAAGSDAARCGIWKLYEPEALAPWRWYDQARYWLGLPWSASFLPNAWPLQLFGCGGRAEPTTKPRRTDLPPYVERCGLQDHLQPFLCANTRMYGFFVRGDASSLQRNVVDPILKGPTRGAMDYRVLSDLVMVTFAYTAEGHSLRTPDRQMGWIPERSCTVWVLTAAVRREGGVDVAERVVFFAPYIVVDNPWSMASGREIYGFPKTIGAILMPVDSAAPDAFSASTIILPVFQYAQQGSDEIIIRVDRTAAEPAPPAVWSSGTEAARAVLSQWSSGGRRLMVPGLGLAIDLFDLLRHEVVPTVYLKQFRDAADGMRACYQAIVEAPMTMRKLHGGGPLSGSYTLTACDFASHPIVHDLGLPQKTVPAEFPFFVDFDFVAEAGTEVWKA